MKSPSRPLVPKLFFGSVGVLALSWFGFVLHDLHRLGQKPPSQPAVRQTTNKPPAHIGAYEGLLSASPGSKPENLQTKTNEPTWAR